MVALWFVGSNGAALDRNGTVDSKLDGSSVSMPPSDEKETKAVMTRRSSIIRDPSERRNRIKKTVSFTSNPNSRKIITGECWDFDTHTESTTQTDSERWMKF